MPHLLPLCPSLLSRAVLGCWREILVDGDCVAAGDSDQNFKRETGKHSSTESQEMVFLLLNLVQKTKSSNKKNSAAQISGLKRGPRFHDFPYKRVVTRKTRMSICSYDKNGTPKSLTFLFDLCESDQPLPTHQKTDSNSFLS